MCTSEINLLNGYNYKDFDSYDLWVSGQFNQIEINKRKNFGIIKEALQKGVSIVRLNHVFKRKLERIATTLYLHDLNHDSDDIYVTNYFLKAVAKTIKLVHRMTPEGAAHLQACTLTSQVCTQTPQQKDIHLLPDQQVHQVDLSQFSAKELEAILTSHPALLRKFNPQTVAQNISKFPVKFLQSETIIWNGHPYRRFPGSGLTPGQIAALNISKLNQFQLNAIGLHPFTPRQIYQLDLSPFVGSVVNDLTFSFEHNRMAQFNPKTIGENYTKISHMLYHYFSDEQVRAIDYQTLPPDLKVCFSTRHRLMKNFRISNTPFTAHFPQSPKTEQPNKRTEQPSKSKEIKYRPNDLITYQNSLMEANAEIVNNDVSSNAAYEAIRNKISSSFQFTILKPLSCQQLKNDPRLFFDTNPELVTQNSVCNYYKKLALLLHPDRNQQRKEEANVLFKVLSAAFDAIVHGKVDAEDDVD